jgi:hypothetical protein
LFEIVQRLLVQNQQKVQKARTIHNNLMEALGRQQSALENIFNQQRPITEQDYSIIKINFIRATSGDFGRLRATRATRATSGDFGRLRATRATLKSELPKQNIFRITCICSNFEYASFVEI